MTLKVLIIDDNDPNLTLAETLLERQGFEVITVKHISRLKTILEENPEIGLILLDLVMPASSGYTLHKEMRDLGIKAPIVAHTVHVDQLSKIQSAGFDGLLPKPINLAKFPQFIEATLNGETIWDN